MIKRNSLVPNTSTFLQTSAAEAHLAEGTFFTRIADIELEKFPIYRAGTRKQTIFKREGQPLR
jgi:hypothetical protein